MVEGNKGVKLILHHQDFDNGSRITVARDNWNELLEWRGLVIRGRRGRLPMNSFNIRKYFPNYSGKAFIVSSPDGGKSLNFVGSGPLKIKGLDTSKWTETG